ncbi:unnamed protein product [Schistosoma curassoni]|uniref:Sen15 domain-containing protein n=1 Tax=Schistosoma curassoni TaxID=6186 RepID=A0A183JW54_9TREM|nr:unnamed protein product [Schistosoma curassoni]
MVVGGSQQETLDPGVVLLGTGQQAVPVIFRELVLHGGFDPVSASFTVRDITTLLTSTELRETQVQGFLLTTSNQHLISIYSARSVESPRLVVTMQHGR